jgi:hypothetical protein
MLIEPNFKPLTKFDQGLLDILREPPVEKFEPGVYTGPVNFDMHLGPEWEGWELQLGPPALRPDGEPIVLNGTTFCEWGSYGVCDSPEQLLAHPLGKWVQASDRKFCIALAHISKADQSPEGGWRWHKWGEYIGEGTPTTEYLYDEEQFEDGVWVYHIYELVA